MSRCCLLGQQTSTLVGGGKEIIFRKSIMEMHVLISIQYLLQKYKLEQEWEII